MIYIAYESAKRRFMDTWELCQSILDEQEKLFQRTQPSSIKYDQDRVSGGSAGNAFDCYIIEKDRKKIESRIAEAKELLDERKKLLQIKEQELRTSRALIDRIYCMRILDKMRVNTIASRIGYAESHVYRFLKKIEESLKDERK